MQVTKFQKKIILFLTLIIILLLWLIEVNNIMIDKYNFRQLPVLTKIFDLKLELKYDIRNLVDFNEKYNQNIIPKWGCYYVSTFNWDYPYIIWFKIHSFLYKNIYKSNQYIYPEYKIPISQICVWRCHDVAKQKFEDTINNSCEWNISWYVYNDKNENWIKDEWEEWIAWVWVSIDTYTIFTDKTWFYSSNVSPSKWWHRIRADYFNEWLNVTILTPNSFGKGYENIVVKRKENIKNLNFWAKVYK